MEWIFFFLLDFLWHLKRLDGKVLLSTCKRVLTDGYNSVFDFSGLECLEVVMIYFFVVETKGLSLEGINGVFDKPNNPVPLSFPY